MHRQHRVRVNKQLSRIYTRHAGVPQGSIPSPVILCTTATISHASWNEPSPLLNSPTTQPFGHHRRPLPSLPDLSRDWRPNPNKTQVIILRPSPQQCHQQSFSGHHVHLWLWGSRWELFPNHNLLGHHFLQKSGLGLKIQALDCCNIVQQRSTLLSILRRCIPGCYKRILSCLCSPHHWLWFYLPRLCRTGLAESLRKKKQAVCRRRLSQLYRFHTSG